MNAYNTNDAIVNKKCVLKAASEALGDEVETIAWWHNSAVKTAAIATSLFAMLFLGLWWGNSAKLPLSLADDSLAVAEVSPSSQQKLVIMDNAAVTKVIEEPVPSLEITPASQIPTNEIQQSAVVAVPDKSIAENTQEQLVIKVEDNHQEKSQDTHYKVNSVDGVSDEFLARFQSAIDETSPEKSEQLQNSENIDNFIPPLTDMPSRLQKSIPNLEFDMHIYASDGEGWVRVNGRDRYEGDEISKDLFLDKILPQKVILSYQGELFSLPALSTW